MPRKPRNSHVDPVTATKKPRPDYVHVLYA